MNDDNNMHSLHDQANESFVRRLLNDLPAMRFKLGYISQAIESSAGSAPIRLDAPGQADAGRDIDGCEGLIA